jgi:hypothetical protein
VEVLTASRLFIGRRQTFAGILFTHGSEVPTATLCQQRVVGPEEAVLTGHNAAASRPGPFVFEMCFSRPRTSSASLCAPLSYPLASARASSSSTAVSSRSAMAYGDQGRVSEGRGRSQRRNSAAVTGSGGRLQSGERKDARLPGRAGGRVLYFMGRDHGSLARRCRKWSPIWRIAKRELWWAANVRRSRRCCRTSVCRKRRGWRKGEQVVSRRVSEVSWR